MTFLFKKKSLKILCDTSKAKYDIKFRYYDIKIEDVTVESHDMSVLCRNIGL